MRNLQHKRIASFKACKTVADYYAYMKQQAYRTPLAQHHLEQERQATYDRVLRSDSIKFYRNGKKL